MCTHLDNETRIPLDKENKHLEDVERVANLKNPNH